MSGLSTRWSRLLQVKNTHPETLVHDTLTESNDIIVSASAMADDILVLSQAEGKLCKTSNGQSSSLVHIQQETALVPAHLDGSQHTICDSQAMGSLRLQDLPEELKLMIYKYIFRTHSKKMRNKTSNFLSVLAAAQHRSMYTGAKRVWCDSHSFGLQLDEDNIQQGDLLELEKEFWKDVKRLYFRLPSVLAIPSYPAILDSIPKLTFLSLDVSSRIPLHEATVALLPSFKHLREVRVRLDRRTRVKGAPLPWDGVGFIDTMLRVKCVVSKTKHQHVWTWKYVGEGDGFQAVVKAKHIKFE